MWTQKQCLSRKKDEKFQQFLVLFLSVGIFNFILLYRKHPVEAFSLFFKADFTQKMLKNSEKISINEMRDQNCHIAQIWVFLFVRFAN